MSSINSVSMVGRVGKMGDNAFRTLPSGVPCLSFSVALSSYTKDAAGNLTEKTTWVDCTYFGKSALGIQPYVRTGTLLGVHGRLDMSEWLDKATGAKRTKIGVIADSVQLLAQPQDKTDAPATAQQAQQAQPAQYQQGSCYPQNSQPPVPPPVFPDGYPEDNPWQ